MPPETKIARNAAITTGNDASKLKTEMTEKSAARYAAPPPRASNRRSSRVAIPAQIESRMY